MRRLALRVGEAASFEVVWVDVPSLAISRVEQRYERLAEDRYRYSAGSFSAEITVDEDGLVRDYEHVAARLFRR
jgi:hypothetical protein